MTIAFDVDGTLIHEEGSLCDTPRYKIINLMKLFDDLGCDIFIWSGGGVDYAQRWADKLGLRYKVVSKGSFKPDLSVDDEEVNLGKINLRVRRVR